MIIPKRKATYLYHRPNTRLLTKPGVLNLNSEVFVDPDFDEIDPDEPLTGIGLDHLYQGNGAPIHLNI